MDYELLRDSLLASGYSACLPWLVSDRLHGDADVARFLFLRSLWDEVCSPRAMFSPRSGRVYQKAIEAGLTNEDIDELTFAIVDMVEFGFCNVLDGRGEQGTTASGFPGWGLFEVDENGVCTGRRLEALHETRFSEIVEAGEEPSWGWSDEIL